MDNVLLRSTEIISADGTTTKGKNMPYPLINHAIASVDESRSIITGGSLSCNHEQIVNFEIPSKN